MSCDCNSGVSHGGSSTDSKNADYEMDGMGSVDNLMSVYIWGKEMHQRSLGSTHSNS